MSDKFSDEDLLANAIPIDLSGEEEEEHAKLKAPDDGIERSDDADLTPIDLDEGGLTDDPNQKSMIQVFGENTRKAHADHWNRTPNATGSGAIHVKTFVAKLRLDAIDNLDEQVNNWLDNHPEYEVKFVTTSVGKLVGKISEDAIFMNVWV
ncbi:hypothetical protein [Algisphaera agarilytica]|uniref:Uncharacterized protein n=1 Tax=Algisphaera agarilytica TaxID=1385975 RepID=A0A7X0H7G0_9BACT|nr:hypothetical protein [Algisphaera agarilytica]MBB6430685.1 hypothetical protein [Algisphaera agarilytica]